MSSATTLARRVAAPQGRVAGLKRLLARPPKKRKGEACEMCAVRIAAEHSHVVDLEGRGLLCTCRPCWLLFTHPGAAQGKFRAVPDRVRFVPDFRLGEPLWDEMQIPVRLAFLFTNSSLGRVVAFYPSPAGATQSELPLGAWDTMVRDNPVLGSLRPDVEALLVFGREHESTFTCFLVPIDACYELTGLVRRRWKGFDGGTEVWDAIDAFFARLRERASEVGVEATA